MSEKEEILFMQTRLIRLAAEEWKFSMVIIPAFESH